MRRRIYRAAALATVIGCVVLGGLSWYTVGVIEKSNMSDALQQRVEQIALRIDKQTLEYDRTTRNVYDNCKEKTRALALLISKSSDKLNDETWLEEMRLMIDAEVICIFDENGSIEYTTGLSQGEPKIFDEFRAGLNDKVFSEAVAYERDGQARVAAGSSRLDKKGVVQVEFRSDSISTLLSIIDNSNALTDIPVMKTGSMGVIDPESGKYLCHTDKSMVGMNSFLDPKSQLSNEKGDTIDAEIGGREVLLHYDQGQLGIIVGYVPYSEVYETRNGTTLWVILVAAIVSAVTVLTVRNKVLHIRRKKAA